MAIAVALATPLGALTPAATAAGGKSTAQIAHELREHRLYIDPSQADRMTTSEAQTLRTRLAASVPNIFLLVLPPEDSVKAATLRLGRIATATGIPGVYAAVAGNLFVGGSLDGVVPSAPQIAADVAAVDDGHSPAALLNDFLTATVAAAAQQISPTGTPSPTTTAARASGTAPASRTIWIAALAVIAIGAAFVLGRNLRRPRTSRDSTRLAAPPAHSATDEDADSPDTPTPPATAPAPRPDQRWSDDPGWLDDPGWDDE